MSLAELENKSASVPMSNTMCYLLNGILMVPHYKIKDVFVGPGLRDGKTLHGPNNKTYTAAQLIDAGAVTAMEFLWDRTPIEAEQ